MQAKQIQPIGPINDLCDDVFLSILARLPVADLLHLMATEAIKIRINAFSELEQRTLHGHEDAIVAMCQLFRVLRP